MKNQLKAKLAYDSNSSSNIEQYDIIMKWL